MSKKAVTTVSVRAGRTPTGVDQLDALLTFLEGTTIIATQLVVATSGPKPFTVSLRHTDGGPVYGTVDGSRALLMARLLSQPTSGLVAKTYRMERVARNRMACEVRCFVVVRGTRKVRVEQVVVSEGSFLELGPGETFVGPCSRPKPGAFC